MEHAQSSARARLDGHAIAFVRAARNEKTVAVVVVAAETRIISGI